MATTQTIAIAWLKKYLWDRLDRPDKYDSVNVLKDVRSRLEKKSTLETPPPSLAASSLSFSDVTKIFRLKISVDDSYNVWKLAENELYDIPITLTDSLSDLAYVMGDSEQNEAFCRCHINAILISCIAAERRFAEETGRDTSIVSSQSPPMIELERPVTPGETKPLQLQLETPLKYLVEYEGEARMLTGFADYSLWYDKKDMGTNLVVVEAKRFGNTASAKSQCLAYMAIVHDIRKAAQKLHKVIYGICTDGTQYQFLRIDNNSVVTRSQPFEWGPTIINKTIISYIRYIIRAAINSSPRTSPVKPGVEMETNLRAYNSRTEFDYGFRGLSLREEDDDEEYGEGEEFVEMSDID